VVIKQDCAGYLLLDPYLSGRICKVLPPKAEEAILIHFRIVGITVDASKRKWKNLRDSYTKYLRSYRVGTKTAKKYQFWAHAEHMEFLKPFQGPG
ncbi:hypothetical protein DOY81_014300, partial [Sarcophaga bullata]